MARGLETGLNTPTSKLASRLLAAHIERITVALLNCKKPMLPHRVALSGRGSGLGRGVSAAQDERAMLDDMMLGGRAIHRVEQQIDRDSGHALSIASDRGQPDDAPPGCGHVVEPDDGHVLWHRKAQLAGCAQSADRDDIVSAEHR
jgi:hypothetical protein